MKVLLLIILVNASCTNFGILKQEYLININQWTNKKIIFADVSKMITEQGEINKKWLELNSGKSIPYFKMKKFSGVILGDYVKNNENFLVVQLENKKKYKCRYDNKRNLLPSHIAFIDDIENAKKYIGKTIWLNDIFVDSIFINNTDVNYKKFQKVDVLGVRFFQNSKIDIPIWLEVGLKNQPSSYVRYNGKFKYHSRQNNYFTENPLKKVWANKILKNIIKGEIDYNMSFEQVRAAIGNPDIINNTSSRHGVSQQWIYGKGEIKKRYLLFENGKLSSK